MDDTPATADTPVDPATIRYRPGVRREGAFGVRYATIHGYRRVRTSRRARDQRCC